MQIRLLAVGSRVEDWVASGFESYRQRLPAQLRLELTEIPLGNRSGGGDSRAAVEQEGRRIQQKLRPADYVIALDERGRQWTSAELAQQLARWLAEERSIALLIGGPDGLSAACRASARCEWSLSPLTFPHGLVRVLVAEQLYRAWSILQGHPYHRP